MSARWCSAPEPLSGSSPGRPPARPRGCSSRRRWPPEAMGRKARIRARAGRAVTPTSRRYAASAEILVARGHLHGVEPWNALEPRGTVGHTDGAERDAAPDRVEVTPWIAGWTPTMSARIAEIDALARGPGCSPVTRRVRRAAERIGVGVTRLVTQAGLRKRVADLQAYRKRGDLILVADKTCRATLGLPLPALNRRPGAEAHARPREGDGIEVPAEGGLPARIHAREAKRATGITDVIWLGIDGDASQCVVLVPPILGPHRALLARATVLGPGVAFNAVTTIPPSRTLAAWIARCGVRGRIGCGGAAGCGVATRRRGRSARGSAAEARHRARRRRGRVGARATTLGRQVRR